MAVDEYCIFCGTDRATHEFPDCHREAVRLKIALAQGVGRLEHSWVERIERSLSGKGLVEEMSEIDAQINEAIRFNNWKQLKASVAPDDPFAQKYKKYLKIPWWKPDFTIWKFLCCTVGIAIGLVMNIRDWHHWYIYIGGLLGGYAFAHGDY